MSREVTLVLTTPEGRLLGALPSFSVELPYWQEVREVVATARKLYGVEVAVLRLLTTEPGLIRGGRVSYLAEVAFAPEHPLAPVTLDTSDHPLRPDYARPGGPERSLQWARSHVDIVAAEQQRTWNLSAIWRLETPSGTVWLKQVPGFFTHEAAVLSYLERIRAYGNGRMLLDHLPGNDLYGADAATRQPGLDILRLTEDLEAGPAAVLIEAWAGWWRALIPGCDPLAAVAALRPVAALRNARVYADFLANIEPSEHPYHAADVPYWLAEAERLAAAGV